MYDREYVRLDAVLLISCERNPSRVLEGLSKQSRHRVRVLAKELAGNPVYFSSHDQVVQSLAREAIEEMFKVAS